MGERVYRAGPGLDVVVEEALPPDARPMAVIHIRVNDRVKLASPSSRPWMIQVRVSLSRLHSLLGGSDAAERILAERRSNRGDIPIENGALVCRIRDEIAGSTYDPVAFHLFLQAKVIELLINGVAPVPPAGELPPPLVSAAVDRLLASPLAPPTMAELASSLGTSPRTLRHQFKGFFGMCIPDWLTEWRLLRAKELVVEGALPLGEIATSLGYAHLSNFTSAFSKRFGQPPASRRRFEQTTVITGSIRASGRDAPMAVAGMPAIPTLSPSLPHSRGASASRRSACVRAKPESNSP